METPFEGGCQCGRIRYRCTAPPFVTYTCHCGACRRLTSSAFLTCMQVPAEALRLEGGPPATWSRIADSGNRLVISFCDECGSGLFIAPDARPRLRTILVGTLDEPERAEVDAHIWTRSKLPWVVIPNGHRDFAGAADWRPDYAADPTRLDP